MSLTNPSMEDLPPDVMADILSRLPVKTIIHCNCVCKKWRNLLLGSYFVNLHLARSPAGLIIYHNADRHMIGGHKLGILKWVEIEDELDHHHLHHDPVMSVDLNLVPSFHNTQILIVGSVDGLICLWHFGPKGDDTYICNPITREYMILPRQKRYDREVKLRHGFGVNLRTGEYKVIRTFQGDIPQDPSGSSRPSPVEAEVYTLGTNQWRSLGHVPYWLNCYDGPFLNNHCHWIACDMGDSPEKLCTFDLDKETFQLFPSPPIEAVEERGIHFQSLAVLKGCLCQSDTIYDSEFTIWVMKEYGIKKSWHKEVVIKQAISPNLDWLMWEPTYLTHALKDGSVLMVYYEDKLLAYHPLSKTVEDTEIFDRYLSGMTYRPSFLKLQNFESESVHVF